MRDCNSSEIAMDIAKTFFVVSGRLILFAAQHGANAPARPSDANEHAAAPTFAVAAVDTSFAADVAVQDQVRRGRSSSRFTVFWYVRADWCRINQ